MALKKLDIVEAVHGALSCEKQQAFATVEALLEIIKSTLESGEDVLISGFGKFEVKHKAPRKGRNPATGESLMLDARKIITFKCSGRLRGMMNGRATGKAKKTSLPTSSKTRPTR